MNQDKKQTNDSGSPDAGKRGAADASQKEAAKVPNTPAAKSLSNWENEGGQASVPTAIPLPEPKGGVKETGPEDHSYPKSIVPDREDQVRAETVAKQSKIKEAGIESQRLGHASSSGRHNQARRDSKN